MTDTPDPTASGERAAGNGAGLVEIGPDGALTFEAERLAPLLGLSAPGLLEEVRKGLVYHVHEIGTGPDEGTRRVTFRYRSRELRLLIDEAGRVLPADAPHPARPGRAAPGS